MDEDDELGWARQTYRIAYKEPFYKGGKVKARVPGWCDRVVCHSMPECRDSAYPEPVQLASEDGNEIVVVRAAMCLCLCCAGGCT